MYAMIFESLITLKSFNVENSSKSFLVPFFLPTNEKISSKGKVAIISIQNLPLRYSMAINLESDISSPVCLLKKVVLKLIMMSIAKQASIRLLQITTALEERTYGPNATSNGKEYTFQIDNTKTKRSHLILNLSLILTFHLNLLFLVRVLSSSSMLVLMFSIEAALISFN